MSENGDVLSSWVLRRFIITIWAVFDVDAKELLKRRDVGIHEDVLGHPFLLQFGLQPGFDSIATTGV